MSDRDHDELLSIMRKDGGWMSLATMSIRMARPANSNVLLSMLGTLHSAGLVESRDATYEYWRAVR